MTRIGPTQTWEVCDIIGYLSEHRKIGCLNHLVRAMMNNLINNQLKAVNV